MNRTLIIAEAGVNHNGSLETAKKMVDAAKECKADIIKFQTFNPASLVSRQAEQAAYQIVNTGKKESQLEMLQKLTLSHSEFKELAGYCRQKEICFLSTPFDSDSIAFLTGLNMPFWKLPSGEITNYPYLVQIAATRQPVVLSTGMSNLEEIEAAMAVLQQNGSQKIQLLHCNTEYPTPFSDVNLKAMKTLEEHFHTEVGYSDHTVGIEVPIAAVAMGAVMIEKHFTLDCTMDGPDHAASLEPREFAEMVRTIRNIELSMGNGVKQPSKSEQKNIGIVRKSIVASKDIRCGEILGEANLTAKRPGTGISPMNWNAVVGKKAVRDYREDEMIEQ